MYCSAAIDSHYIIFSECSSPVVKGLAGVEASIWDLDREKSECAYGSRGVHAAMIDAMLGGDEPPIEAPHELGNARANGLAR